MNASSTAAGDVRPGLVLGRYELLVPIAAGGMAQVWAARLRGARQFQKIVAVKTMLPKLSEEAQFEQMFLDEASLASQIKHPNAVEIMDLGDQAGVLYLVMEWIEGVPLNQLMKTAKGSGGIPYAVSTRIAMHACAGLHAAHELKDERGQHIGLVHRDVSPQNLLVTFDGVTKVVDFGVAKATALGGGATVAGQVKGKVSYMAPEQVNGEGLDRRADIFALGIVLYALTTGKHPFRRESEAATMFAICAPEPVLAPSKVVAGYPAELEPIVLKALAKDRNHRFASCDEMLRALDALPPSLRLSSDSDVGSYVNSLFGDKRIEQRRKIEEATALVESGALQGIWPPNDAQSQVTNRRSLASMTGSQELSGLPTALYGSGAKNRWIGIAGLGALAVSGGVLFTAATGKSDADVRAIAPPVPPTVVSASRNVAPAPDRREEPMALDALPTAAKDATSEEPKAPTSPPGATSASPASKTPAKAPAKKKSDNFKMDAGF